MTTATDVTGLPALDHDEAMALQAAELDRTVALLRSFGTADWAAQTECPDWNVHQMYLHILGACEAGASMAENLRQLRAAKKHQKRHGGPLEASLSAVQVAKRTGVAADELPDRLTTVAPQTVRGRARTPKLLRKMKMSVDGPVIEKWRLGYLIDTIYLRDLWMHRIDASRATGREIELTAGHDGRIVADVVAEWARRHGYPFILTLTGPAGGRFTSTGQADAASTEPVELELDAVEFCRSLAGRAEAEGLMTTIVPF